MRLGKRHTRQADENKGEYSEEDGAPLEMVRHTPPEEEFALWVSRLVSVFDGNKGTWVQEERWVKRKAVNRWPIDDEIRWVEQRLRERLPLEEGLMTKE